MLNRKVIIATVIVMAIAAVTATASFAGSMTFGFRPGSLIADGEIWGWGFADKDVSLTARGYATALCQNGGGKVAPGRNPVYVNVVATNTFHTDVNGRTGVFLEAFETLQSAAPSPSPKTAGCPSSTWTLIGLSYRATNWTSATITARDSANGNVLITKNYACVTTFGPDTNGDGVAESVAVSCTETP